MAFAMGALAHRLKISPLVGYLFAGVIIGPFTPGFVADSRLANELAELGVILLMFGVGLHFSLRDLLAVKNIAVPGALVQTATATGLGLLLALSLGWSFGTGIVFGLALSVASTVVLLRALQGRKLLDTDRGRIAVGWLIVEDLVMVITIVLLPVLAGIMKGGNVSAGEIGLVLGTTALKVASFVAAMLLIGRRVIPSLLHWAAHSGSRELFRLAVLAVALGVAFGAAFLFDVSFALGAFFAGMILGETPLSKRAAEETLPLRDAFAVLFFVSVGMLFDPAVIVEQPVSLLATLAIIVIGKSVAAFAIVRMFGHPTRTALTISASLAQIGEFSFILAGIGATLGMIPPEARDLVLGGAILSILLNPLVFALAAGGAKKLAPSAPPVSDPGPIPPSKAEPVPHGHVILIGYGRVGHLIAAALREAGRPFVLIEDQKDIAASAAATGLTVITGNATEPDVLEEARLHEAAGLLIAIPEGFEAGGIAARARAVNPAIQIIARAHSDAEVAHLTRQGSNSVVMGEREIARRMLELAMPA